MSCLNAAHSRQCRREARHVLPLAHHVAGPSSHIDVAFLNTSDTLEHSSISILLQSGTSSKTSALTCLPRRKGVALVCVPQAVPAHLRIKFFSAPLAAQMHYLSSQNALRERRRTSTGEDALVSRDCHCCLRSGTRHCTPRPQPRIQVALQRIRCGKSLLSDVVMTCTDREITAVFS